MGYLPPIPPPRMMRQSCEYCGRFQLMNPTRCCISCGAPLDLRLARIPSPPSPFPPNRVIQEPSSMPCLFIIWATIVVAVLGATMSHAWPLLMPELFR